MNDARTSQPTETRHRGALTGTFGGVAVLVILYAGALYLPFLGSGRTLTRHEAMIVQPAEHMRVHGNWLVPQYAGGPWVHKPPLMTWVTVPFLMVAGGFNEFAARLPEALTTIGLCVLMAGLAWRFYGWAAALLAGLIQATMVYTYTQGRLAESDMMLILLVTGAHGVLAWHWREGGMRLPLASAVLYHSLIGLAILTKGPPAIAFAGMTVVTFALVRRSLKPITAVLLTPALACSIVIGFWWYGAVTFALGDWAVGRWEYSYFQRFLGGYHMGTKPLPYYFYTIPWLVLPWTIALLLGARRLVQDARRPTAYLERFLWCWFFGGVVFVTLSVFKHKHYCFPVLPPLTLLAAKLMAEHGVREGRRAWRFYAAVFVVALVAYNVVGGVVMPRRDHRRATVEFVRSALTQVPDDVDLYLAGLAQSALYPYIERPCVYLRDQQEVEAAVNAPPADPMWVLTYRKHLGVVQRQGLRFEEVAGEPVRRKYPLPETLVLGRIYFDKRP
jgi:4-amino-4-deoxy-L-arabinose transferase-like glycosyltransferase